MERTAKRRKTKICMIVPNAAVKGGIASVVNGYRGSALEKRFKIRYVESYCDGSRLRKLVRRLRVTAPLSGSFFYRGRMWCISIPPSAPAFTGRCLLSI